MPPESASAAASAFVQLLPNNAGKLQRFFTPLRLAASSPDIRQTRVGIISLLDEIPMEASASARRQMVGFSLRRWPHLFCDVEIAHAFINNVIVSLPQGEDGEALLLQIETLQKGLQGTLALATPMTQQALASILVPLLRACMKMDAESRPLPLKAVLGLLVLAEGRGRELINACHDLMGCILSLPEGESKTQLLACMVQITAHGASTEKMLALEKGKETLVRVLEALHQAPCAYEHFHSAYTIIEQLPEVERKSLLPLHLAKLKEQAAISSEYDFGVERLPEIWAYARNNLAPQAAGVTADTSSRPGDEDRLYLQAFDVFEAHLDDLDGVDLLKNLDDFAKRLVHLSEAKQMENFDRVCRVWEAVAGKMPESSRMIVWSSLRKSISSLAGQSAHLLARVEALIEERIQRRKQFALEFGNATLLEDARQAKTNALRLIAEILQEPDDFMRRQFLCAAMEACPHLFCEEGVAIATIKVLASMRPVDRGWAFNDLAKTLMGGLDGRIQLMQSITTGTLEAILKPLIATGRTMDVSHDLDIFSLLYRVLLSAEQSRKVSASITAEMIGYAIFVNKRSPQSLGISVLVRALAANQFDCASLKSHAHGRDCIARLLQELLASPCNPEKLVAVYLLAPGMGLSDLQLLLPLIARWLPEEHGIKVPETLAREELRFLWRQIGDALLPALIASVLPRAS